MWGTGQLIQREIKKKSLTTGSTRPATPAREPERWASISFHRKERGLAHLRQPVLNVLVIQKRLERVNVEMVSVRRQQFLGMHRNRTELHQKTQGRVHHVCHFIPSVYAQLVIQAEPLERPA